jgi:hypothetical protein
MQMFALKQTLVSTLLSSDANVKLRISKNEIQKK